MKRTLCAILVVIMCLALCACSGVKQEVYDAAMSSYETVKAGYEDVSEKYEVLKAKLEKYSTVIEALEKEDYDGAIEAVNAMRPAPEVTEVEITMNNLWDYFEITERRSEQTDAQGNQYSLSIINLLSLKEGYNLANRDEYPTDVAVGFEYDMKTKLYWMPVTIDFETMTCNGTAFDRQERHESKMAHFPMSPSLDSCLIIANPSSDLAQLDSIESFEILNASGILYLVNK